MPKGKGYDKEENKWDKGYEAVNVNYSTPHQKTITVTKQPKAMGMGKVGRIGITSMGNTRHGKHKTGY